MNPLKWFYQAPSLLILCLLLGATSISPPCLAAPFSQKEFCKNLTRDKSRQAFLFDETGVEPLPHFDLGHLDITTNRQDADYLMSSKRFRLVLFPKRLHFESLAGGALIDGKAVKPRCPSTNELTFPRNFVFQG